MLATVLYRVEGKPDTGEDAVFSDVVPGAWYAGAVAWISDQSIMTGYGGFGVNDPVTREQVVAGYVPVCPERESGAAIRSSGRICTASSILPWRMRIMKLDRKFAG